MTPEATIGRCGYAEPTDDGAAECKATGKKIVVRDPFGSCVSIVRCRKHSDWIEADEKTNSRIPR